MAPPGHGDGQPRLVGWSPPSAPRRALGALGLVMVKMQLRLASEA